MPAATFSECPIELLPQRAQFWRELELPARGLLSFWLHASVDNAMPLVRVAANRTAATALFALELAPGTLTLRTANNVFDRLALPSAAPQRIYLWWTPLQVCAALAVGAAPPTCITTWLGDNARLPTRVTLAIGAPTTAPLVGGRVLLDSLLLQTLAEQQLPLPPIGLRTTDADVALSLRNVTHCVDACGSSGSLGGWSFERRHCATRACATAGVFAAPLVTRLNFERVQLAATLATAASVREQLASCTTLPDGLLRAAWYTIQSNATDEWFVVT